MLLALASEQGLWAVLDYRFRRWARGLRAPARQLLSVPRLISRKLIETVAGVSIADRAEFGPGLYVGHFGGIIVGGGVVVGENCNLSQNVTVGAHDGSPRIGDCAYLAPGAKVFGHITIGDHVAIGANAVVNQDVPSFATAVADRVTILEDRGNPMSRPSNSRQSSAREGR